VVKHGYKYDASAATPPLKVQPTLFPPYPHSEYNYFSTKINIEYYYFYFCFVSIVSQFECKCFFLLDVVKAKH
jgi:hypothetical protein